MPTTSELRVLQGRQHGLLFLIDGCEVGFTNTRGLVGYDTGADHDVRLGLLRDISFTMSIDLPSGQFNDNPAHFTIEDLDDDLDDLFKAYDDTEQDLGNVPFGEGTPISPSEDLSARTDLHGLNVGTERIGSAGERRRFAVPPGFEVGLEHRISLADSEIAGAPVTSTPIVWRGRRCMLWRVYRDHVTYPDRSVGLTAWRPMSEAVLLWYGTLQDQAILSGRKWTLRADGPESWLRKPLGVGFDVQKDPPVKAVGDISLSSEENNDSRQIAVRLLADNTSYGSSIYAAPLTDGTVGEIRDQVIAVIEAAKAAAGIGGVVWDEEPGFHLQMDDNSAITIAVPNGTLAGGELRLELHKDVWTALGYDVVNQPLFDQEPDEPRAVGFVQVPNNYSSDYYEGYFPTGRDVWPDGQDNAGVTRQWVPQYTSGNHVFFADLNGGRGQVVRLGPAAFEAGVTSTSVRHPGQLSRPISSDPLDDTAPISISGIGECDRQGYFLFYGKRRWEAQEDEFDEWWVGRACWQGAGLQEEGLINGDTIIVVEWFDARMFGFPRGRPLSDWVARVSEVDGEEKGMTFAVPIIALAYFNGDARERADQVMQRLLLSTGTSSGWSAPAADDPELDHGDNEPADLDYSGSEQVRDAEVADLGLAIPEDFVQPQGAWQQEVELVETPDILSVKVAFSSGYQAEDVFRSLMQPVGWCWHMRGGRLGVFCPAHSITLADATVVLDRSAKAKSYEQQAREVGGKRKGSEQKLRAFAPVDKWIASFNWAPHLNRVQTKATTQSPDPGYSYRPGAVDRQVMAHHHRPNFTGWTQHTAMLARWWALRHFLVKDWPVHLVDPGEDCWTGTIVDLTDPELVHPDGTRGIVNAPAVIVGTRTDIEQGVKLLDLVIPGDRTTTPYLHAPIARGIGYDSSTRRLYVRDNEFRIASPNGTWSDARQFVESALGTSTLLGGQAIVRCLQWDGVSFTETLRGDVESVVTTTGGAYIQLAAGTTSGTYLRDMDTLVIIVGRVDTAGQDAAWVLARYAPICDEDGNFDEGTGAEPGFNWEP